MPTQLYTIHCWWQVEMPYTVHTVPKWSVEIGELKKELSPITHRILSQQLKASEAEQMM